jgi:Peptidase propeptide and YPEB domain
MHSFGRLAIGALILIAPAPAGAEPAVRVEHPLVHSTRVRHACLDLKEQRIAIESGKVVPLAVAMRAARKRMAGSVVRARLCNGRDGLVYVLTILPRDGKVVRVTVDAAKGAVIGKH